MPTLNAECSLDLGCPIEEFNAFCDAHRIVPSSFMLTPQRRSKRADWVVTSSIAVELIEHLDSLGENSLGTRPSLRPVRTAANRRRCFVLAGRLYCPR